MSVAAFDTEPPADYLSEDAAAKWLTHLQTAPCLASIILFTTVADA